MIELFFKKSMNIDGEKTTHECFVCGDTIDLTAQVCSRYCMRVLEQMETLDSLDTLEAQVVPSPTNSSSTSDYEKSENFFKIVPEQRAEPFISDDFAPSLTLPHKSY